MCLYPKLILNRKYLPNKKNGGNPPQIIDERTKYVPIGCGKCIECKKQRANGWRIRLQEEIRQKQDGKFITLTFSNESLTELEQDIENPLKGYELDNQIIKLAVRRFLERWRKETGKSVRHWLVSELGQIRTERVHIHGIIWTSDIKAISDIWQYGNVWIGDYVNEKTINYIVHSSEHEHMERYLAGTDDALYDYVNLLKYMPRLEGSEFLGAERDFKKR